MKLAYRKEFLTEPLAQALAGRGWQVIPSDDPAELLVSGTVDIVLDSPLDYARSIGVVDYAMAPGIGLISAGFAGLFKLVFNRGLVDFSSIAVKQPDGFAAAIAKVILTEKHNIVPTLITVESDATVEQMLAVADTALLVGEDSIFTPEYTSYLDLTDEWEDLTESALPVLIAWGRVDAVTQQTLDELIAARDQAMLSLADYTTRHPQPEATSIFYQRYLRGNIRYEITAADLGTLETFFRYMFYHVLITDIPAIKFLPAGEPADVSPPKL